MDVLGVLVGVFPRWGAVYRDVEELWVDECNGCAVIGVCGVAGGCVLLFSIAVLCLYSEFRLLPEPKGQ